MITFCLLQSLPHLILIQRYLLGKLVSLVREQAMPTTMYKARMLRLRSSRIDYRTHLDIRPLVEIFDASIRVDSHPGENVDIGNTVFALTWTSKPIPRCETDFKDAIKTLRLLNITLWNKKWVSGQLHVEI